MSRAHLVAVAFALFLPPAGCTPPGPPPVAVPGSTGPTGPTGQGFSPTGPTGPGESPAPAPAAPVAPPPLPVTSIEARTGTATLALSPDGTPEPVDPASIFEVRLGIAARGTRLVLLDSRDAMVPSTSEAEAGGGASRFTLVPHETLVPAGRYVLRLEGLDSREVKSDDGRSFEPVAVAFRVAGEPPPPPPKKVKKKRTR